MGRCTSIRTSSTACSGETTAVALCALSQPSASTQHACQLLWSVQGPDFDGRGLWFWLPRPTVVSFFLFAGTCQCMAGMSMMWTQNGTKCLTPTTQVRQPIWLIDGRRMPLPLAVQTAAVYRPPPVNTAVCSSLTGGHAPVPFLPLSLSPCCSGSGAGPGRSKGLPKLHSAASRRGRGQAACLPVSPESQGCSNRREGQCC